MSCGSPSLSFLVDGNGSDADAGGRADGDRAEMVEVTSSVLMGAAVVEDAEMETEGSMGGNWGSGRPAARASALAASWESMRW